MVELDPGSAAAHDDGELALDGREERRVHLPALFEECDAQLGLDQVQRERVDVDVRVVDVAVAFDLADDQGAI